MISRKTRKGRELRLVLEPDNPLCGEERLLLFHSPGDRQSTINSRYCSEGLARKISVVPWAGWNISLASQGHMPLACFHISLFILVPGFSFKTFQSNQLHYLGLWGWRVGVVVLGFVWFFSSNFITIAWLHSCAALKDCSLVPKIKGKT